MINRIVARHKVFWLSTVLCLIEGPSVLAQSPAFSQIGSIPGQADFVEVQGRYVYLVAGPTLKIVDVSEPSAPKVVGTYKFDIEKIYGIAVSGSLVYVAADFMGLAVLDVSNPSMPMLRGKFKTAGQSINVALAGTKALVADTKNGLEIIDVSSPTNPTRQASYYTEGYCRHVAVLGALAYVIDMPTGFSIVDVSKPGQPREVSVQQSLEQPSMIAITQAPQGPKLVCILGRSGLDIYDVSHPAAPVKVTTYKIPGRPRRLKLKGSLAYVADGPDGLQIIDLSNPAKPVIVSSYETPGPAIDVTINDSLVFVTTGQITQGLPTGAPARLPTSTSGVLILRQIP